MRSWLGKYALSPLQNRICWALGEAGSETFYQLLIEVSQSTLYPGLPLKPGARAPIELAWAIEGLMRFGFVVIENRGESGGTRSLEVAAHSVRWIEDKSHWVVKSGQERASGLEIVLTDKAKAAYRTASRKTK